MLSWLERSWSLVTGCAASLSDISSLIHFLVMFLTPVESGVNCADILELTVPNNYKLFDCVVLLLSGSSVGSRKCLLFVVCFELDNTKTIISLTAY